MYKRNHLSKSQSRYEIWSVLRLLKGATWLSILLLPLLFGHSALAAGAGAPHFDGASLPLIWAIPFVGILLSIAIFPLVLPHFWHSHFGKISAFWALSLLIPFLIMLGVSVTLYEILHVLFLEYIPFILLLMALFTITGGIRLTGALVGTPVLNLGFLILGTVLASWMGTTGAAMLLIHPLLKANQGRRYQVHSVVFFIFLVANIGGSLTPIGDPPLFLGFLKGVNFFWTTEHMLLPMLVTAGLLLVIYFILESLLYRKETDFIANRQNQALDEKSDEKLGLTGSVNFLLLAGVIGLVLLSGFWKPDMHVTIYYVPVELQNIVRDVGLVMLAILSWKLTDKQERTLNGFTWFPIVEVAKLFAGIFITIIPVIAILKSGLDGSLADVVRLVSTEQGEPNNLMYFWVTGILSSFLDNAPTYLVFFNTAGGDAAHLMGPLADTLLAISMGAVFMGANTYIGNAPNFMVRSIAVERGVKMPSFFGYMLWSVVILTPIFILVSFIWL